MTPDQLAALHTACFTTPRPWSATEFADLLAAPGVFIVATGQHAMAMGRVILDEVEMLTIATAPGHQRQGLGAQTLEKFEKHARADGATQAFLEVATTNLAARALYLADGWVITGTRPGYYQTPDGTRVDAEIMCKTLA